MAVTVTQVTTNQSRMKIYSVVKTADGDSSASITHNLPYAPEIITFKPIGAKFYTQKPIVTTVTSSTVTLTLDTAGGTGDASAQFQVIIEAPHLTTD